MREASFTFTTPLNVEVVEIKGKECTFVKGDISTTDIDFVDDIMTKNCQESMVRQIKERNMKLDIEHEAFKGKTNEEKEIAKTKIPAGKLIEARVKELGENRFSTRVKGEINNNNKERYEEIKGNLIDKYLDAFSVAFLPIEVKYVQRGDKEIRLLEDVLLLNVALTGNACNTKAQIHEIVAKSMDAMEEYKKRKEKDPSIENHLIVKNQKQNPLSYIWDKINMGDPLSKNELGLLKSALKVADNNSTEAQLAKEYMAKLEAGEKLTYKEYYIFRDLFEVDFQEGINEVPMLASKTSHSTSPKGGSKLNYKKSFNKKMTEEDKKPTEEEAAEAEKAEAEKAEVEKKSLDEEKAKLKSMSEGMKSLTEKYEVVSKENVEIKEAMKGISEALEKITKALEKPIHKSPGVQPNDAATKAAAGSDKSVDPLSLF